MQLRLGHILLNGYLKRIRKVDNASCLACRVDEENIKHFLLRCPGYAHERWPLNQLARMRCKVLMLKTLLGDPQFILPLAVYIQATGRFIKPGECNTMQIRNSAQ